MISKYFGVGVNAQYAITKAALVILKRNYCITGEMKRDVSLFGDSIKCRTCCFLKDAADHMNHASTVNIDMHTQ